LIERCRGALLGGFSIPLRRSIAAAAALPANPPADMQTSDRRLVALRNPH
jgi:hypothetical protein